MVRVVGNGTVLVWYRNDLRLHDHEPLAEAWRQAHRSSSGIIPLYCVDPRQLGQTAFGFPKTGAFRAQFLLESLSDLRRSLQSLGSDLVIRLGHPEDIIPALAKEYAVERVLYHREVTSEETRVERRLAQALGAIGVKWQGFWGHTLYHPDDLPFSLTNLPELFTSFRKQVEQSTPVNPLLAPPDRLPSLPGMDAGSLLALVDIGLTVPTPDARAVLRFVGGETSGTTRLRNYIWQGDHLRSYKETRNGMLGADYSSKFSPWLALGCISPRFIYAEVQRYENERVRNDSTYWLIFELLWRDYFRFIGAKHGDRLFQPEGLQGVAIPWKQDWERFALWQAGKTGYPLVDANMQELAATGFMSNRGRQNVASFLTKNLGIDWRMGAEWFESLLIDYDVCSNWGNWNYTAGVGNDSRGFRFFNITKQAKDYDPEGKYVKHWLPELNSLPAAKIHEPWKLLPVEQERWGVQLGVDYPRPVVDLFQSAEANERIYLSAFPQREPVRREDRGKRGDRRKR